MIASLGALPHQLVEQELLMFAQGESYPEPGPGLSREDLTKPQGMFTPPPHNLLFSNRKKTTNQPTKNTKKIHIHRIKHESIAESVHSVERKSKGHVK